MSLETLPPRLAINDEPPPYAAELSGGDIFPAAGQTIETHNGVEPSPGMLFALGEAATEDEISIEPLASEPNPPPGFQYTPDILVDYDDQVRSAVKASRYQEAPVPSFEDVPTLDIEPAFNPTGASSEEVYACGKVPLALRRMGMATHAELTGSFEPVDMWRILDRDALLDGSGLVASAILSSGTLGDVENFDPTKHLSSNHERRLSAPDQATPFVSFSTDPEHLANTMILKHEFGVKEGRDSVVVRVRVNPDRVLTGGHKKQEEVLLLGGVAPAEYLAAYSIPEFVAAMAPDTPKSGAERS